MELSMKHGLMRAWSYTTGNSLKELCQQGVIQLPKHGH